MQQATQRGDLLVQERDRSYQGDPGGILEAGTSGEKLRAWEYLEEEALWVERDYSTRFLVTSNVREVGGVLGSGLQGGTAAEISPKRREKAAKGCPP